MKRKPLKTGALVLIMAVIYLFGVAAGVFIVSYMTTGDKRIRFELMVDGFADAYASGGELDPTPLSGIAAIVYNPDGTTRDYIRPTGQLVHFDFIGYGVREVQKVMRGERTVRLVYFAKDDTTLGYTSLLYVSVPLYENGEITGVFSWVRNMRDLLESILGYVCAFTLVFAVATVFWLMNLRNQRRYEQMRRQYTDNITHELKSPIASIKALTEALSDGMEKSPNDRSVYYGMILREANRQERMIHDVLEFSKLQSFSIDVSRSETAASEVFEAVCEKYSSLCDLMGIDFEVSEEIEKLPTLYTNAACAQHVLSALLDNAIKFVGDDGRITLSAQTAHKRVTVCIADNGKGIPKEDLTRVFERFYKSHRSDNENGSGLGLAIAKETADSLKEKLWLESEEGEGTRAFFTIALKYPTRQTGEQ